MRYLESCICFVAVALLAGCASTAQVLPFPDQSKRVVNPEKARIYVMRTSIVGPIFPMEVYEGDRLVGKNGPKGYVCWECWPGPVAVTGVCFNRSTIEVLAKRGQAYYIWQHAIPGYQRLDNRLELVSETQGKELLKKCKPPK